jgi:RNA polymerase sigma-54 factor
MAVGPRLDLRQSQQLVMTPQLQQAIKLLALTNLELEVYLQGELEKNPLLELVAADHDDGPERTEAETLAETPHESPDSVEREVDIAFETGAVQDNPLDADFSSEVFHHDSVSDSPEGDSGSERGLDGSLSLTGSLVTGGPPEEGESFEAGLSAEVTLAEHLIAQVGIALTDPVDLIIGRYLIDQINESGYFIGGLADAAIRLGIAESHCERILKVIQQFDPIGVGARTLSECLMLQAREADRLDPAMETLLNNLELLARGELPALKRLCRVDQEDLADMIQELRGYNPKPGLAFGGERIETVVPDIYVRKNAAGSWQVELNSATLPRVLVNRIYYAEMAGKAANRDDKVFLSECLQSANWLARTLDQRARTVLKVATELVRQQEDFFERGVAGLRPLNLKVIAEAVSMHESTISRVTTSKYLSCSRGLFELKYFFSSAIGSTDDEGESHAAETVKQRIKDLIDAEAANAILSDDKLVELLQAERFDIARRTVAKYRESLRIPSSVIRRRLKAFGTSNAA